VHIPSRCVLPPNLFDGVIRIEGILLHPLPEPIRERESRAGHGSGYGIVHGQGAGDGARSGNGNDSGIGYESGQVPMHARK